MAKKAAKKTSAKKTSAKKTSRRGKPEAGSRGVDALELEGGGDDAVRALVKSIGSDGGSVLATYRDPLGGKWQVLAGLPLDKVEPTPFQRDLSAAHAKRMTDVIDKLDRFLDPVIAVRTKDGKYWTPNGLHRLTAMRNLGAKAIVALVMPEFELCYKILALNTEKAHTLKEKALEVVRMARSLADLKDAPESDYALEFEEPALLTVGICYEEKPRFSGGPYSPILRRTEVFSDASLSDSLVIRQKRAKRILAIDELVGEAVDALKKRGFDSPYLRNFVVANINPLRGTRGKAGEDGPSVDEVLDKMAKKAEAFDPASVSEDQIQAGSGGGGEEGGE